MRKSRPPLNVRKEVLPDPRQEAYLRLWSCVQPLVSLISGLPPKGQEPKFVWTRSRIYICIVIWLITGSLLSILGKHLIEHSALWGVFLVLAGWLLTTGAFRSMMTTLLHDIVHVLEKTCKQNKSQVFSYLVGWVGELVTVILLLPSIAEYYADHILNHHNGRKFCTLADPDAKLLFRLGFQPGKSRRALWWNFWTLIAIPWSTLYRLFTWERLHAQFASLSRFVFTVVTWMTILALATLCGCLTDLLWAVVVPLVFGIPAAALCQFTSEHNWLVERKTESLRQFLRKTCRGRVFIDPLPQPQGYSLRWLLLWANFWFRLFFVHAVTRIVVCPFDLGSGHDLHHFGEEMIKKGHDLPHWASWMNAGHYRRWVEENHLLSIQLTTYFSLYEALDSVFYNYSQLDPKDPHIERASEDQDRPAGLFGM